MHVCGYEARIGIRKLVTAKNDRDRITIDDLWYHYPPANPADLVSIADRSRYGGQVTLSFIKIDRIYSCSIRL